jgi:hypothetical protein
MNRLEKMNPTLPCLLPLATSDERQALFPFALTHYFCYRNDIVASMECYRKSGGQRWSKNSVHQREESS